MTKIKRELLASLASLLLRTLKLTWRVRLIGPRPEAADTPLVYCFWHGRQAGLFAYPRRGPVAVLSSPSRDGALQARILTRLGFLVLRGSSSRRGALGLFSLIRAMKKGSDAAFAVDGPRGPKGQVKPGAVFAAIKAGGKLVPITTDAPRCFRFSKTWDDYQLPKPFARVDLRLGAAMSTTGKQVEELSASLEAALHSLEDESRLKVGATF